MGEKSRVNALPADVRAALNRQLINNGFTDFRGLSAWLKERGFEVSRMAVHRHGARLQRRIDSVRWATEAAEALVEGSGDERGAMADASLRIVQQRFFDLLLQADADDVDLEKLSKAGRAVADLSRAGSSLRAERRKIVEAAADAAEQAAERAADEAGVKLPETVLQAIRRDVYGMIE